MTRFALRALTAALPAALFLSARLVFAADVTPEATIQQQFKKQLGVDIKKEAISKMPFWNLYEVQIGRDIVYTDSQANYMFYGSITNLKTKHNYTAEKLKKLNPEEKPQPITFADLPKDLAIRIVKGTGEGTIAIFSDPFCHYCQQLEANLRRVDNVTIMLYPYNILSKQSAEVSKNVWCSENPAKAWQDWMLNHEKPRAAPSYCKFPNEKILELGKKLKIKGTPTIFFEDGTRVPGAAEAEDIIKKLELLREARD